MSYRRISGLGDDDRAARDAEHFSHAAIRVGQMMQAIVHENVVEGIVGKREMFGVADHGLERKAKPGCALTRPSNGF